MEKIIKNELSKEKLSFGTHEWSAKTANFIGGCSNDCKYCYAKEMGIRFKRKTADDWKEEVVNEKLLNQKVKRIDGTIMFPSSHDITPVNLHYSIQFLHNLLNAGNEVLIVTKPHIKVIEAICSEFTEFKDKIIFRFTIGSTNSEVLKFWEPGAPSYEERKESVIFAFGKGYQTSLSCEPFLDETIDELVEDLQEYITDTIWVGKANKLLGRLKLNGVTDFESIRKANELIELQSDKKIICLYHIIKNNLKIRWKESIMKVLIANNLIK